MPITKPYIFRSAVRASEITDENIYRERRRFLQAGAALGITGRITGGIAGGIGALAPANARAAALKFAKDTRPPDEKLTPLKHVTGYNNFYEFGTDKEDPARHAGSLRTQPWSLAVEGEVAKPAVYALEDFVKPHALQERVYRLRCVEGWSMVIPWIGFPLADVIKRVQPTSRAKFVEFITLKDPEQMPGQRRAVLDWPYREGLRMDEAQHPLTILAVGLYGETLPNQNGAPIRLVVPWKYGFKSAKSIVKIRFVETAPLTTWMASAPREYGFYSNVNPDVDHPRWSQASERRIGEFLKRKTLPFNGYGEQVAHLYTGMDLRKFF